MRDRITKRQKDLLQIIYNYIKSTGYPPTFEEMRERLKVSSNQSVVDLLEKLAKKLLIKKTESGARSIALLPLAYDALGEPPLTPFLGVTHAGAPLEMVEISGEWQSLSPEVAKLKGEISLLRVSGDSMLNAGINDGDLVLVQSAEEFYSGEIVLARVGSESTIKRFISQDKPPYVHLKPENPKYDVILFTDEVELIGKVISVLKNGQWKGVR